MDRINRFVKAQNHIYPSVTTELTQGEKRTHWMWYIFPQLKGLGHSSKSYIYGIDGIDEAKAYLEHPVLSERLKECCELLLTHNDKTAEEILGETDAVKLSSSMTLFAFISEDGSVFHKVLEQFYHELMDKRTLKLLEHELSEQRNIPNITLPVPQGVTDRLGWARWVHKLYTKGKREKEIAESVRIIETLLKADYTEEFLKDFRNRFEVFPDAVRVENKEVLTILLNDGDCEEA